MLSLVPEAIERYVREHAPEESPLLRELARETRERTALPQMQVGRVEGALLRMLTRLTGARRALEIGAFTGYSALCIAEGLHEGGELLTCDIDPEAAAIARKFWARSPHGAKITLRLAPALETLKTLAPPLDFVFLDADKENYVNYYEACLPLLRAGGLLVADNTLWSGRVLDPKDASDRGIAAFNARVKGDPRVEAVMLAVRDGITLVRKK